MSRFGSAIGNRKPRLKEPEVGYTFGRWTVVGSGVLMKDYGCNRMKWPCRCICGTERWFSRSDITGKWKHDSCGCVLITHGLCRNGEHFLYSTWLQMKSRCLRQTSPSFKNYGGRGISVCERWMDFGNFIKDMEHSWTPGTTLGRIENNGNYCPENCRWETSVQQQNNRRDNVFLTFNGKSQTVSQWADEIGIKKQTVWARMKYGMPIEKILGPLLRHAST